MAAAPRAPAIRVVVVDERRLVAEALAALISTFAGFSVTEVLAPETVIDAIAEQAPDVLLMGIPANSHTACELLRTMRDRALTVQTVLLVDRLERNLLEFALDQRLSGLLLTDLPAWDIAECLEQVARGRAVFPAGWQRVLGDEHSDPVGALSVRQLEVLELLAEGCSYAQIASQLFISVNTVKFHTRSIFSQLGVTNRMAAARLFTQRSDGPSAAEPPTVLSESAS